MKFTRIIYLDPSLVSEAYTEITGTSPITRVTRTNDVSGSISGGVFSVGGTTNESREYGVSTTQMFGRIETELRQCSRVEKTGNAEPNGLYWISGYLSIGQESLTRGGETLKELGLYMISPDHEDPNYEDMGRLFVLSTNDTYFTSGYDHLAKDKDMLGNGMWERVEALVRPLFVNRKTDRSLFAPVVILHVADEQ